MAETTGAEDVEVYIRGVTADRVIPWLESLGSVEIDVKQPRLVKLRLAWLHSQIRVVVIPRVKDDFTSVCFQSTEGPFPDDSSCALAAAEVFETEVRFCRPWLPGEEQDLWVSVDSRGARDIVWENG